MPLSGENTAKKNSQIVENQSAQEANTATVVSGAEAHGKVSSMNSNLEQGNISEDTTTPMQVSNGSATNTPVDGATVEPSIKDSALDAAKDAAVTATSSPAQDAAKDNLLTIDAETTKNKNLEHTTQQVGTPPLPMESSFTWGGYFQAIGTLLILLAVLWAVVWLMRKYGRFNFLPKPGAFPRDGLRLESQLPLGPRKGLMVVRFLNKRLLLGVTDHQITLLKETADDENDDNSMEFKDIMEMAKCQKSDD